MTLIASPRLTSPPHKTVSLSPLRCATQNLNLTARCPVLPCYVCLNDEQKNKKGKVDIYVWRAVPPSDDFVALRDVATNNHDVPTIPSYRCVHKALLVEKPLGLQIWNGACAAAYLTANTFAYRSDRLMPCAAALQTKVPGGSGTRLAPPGARPTTARGRSRRTFSSRSQTVSMRPLGHFMSFRTSSPPRLRVSWSGRRRTTPRTMRRRTSASRTARSSL